MAGEPTPERVEQWWGRLRASTQDLVVSDASAPVAQPLAAEVWAADPGLSHWVQTDHGQVLLLHPLAEEYVGYQAGLRESGVQQY